MKKTGIQQAVDAMPGPAFGRESILAGRINVSPQAVNGWVKKGYVPVGRARQVALASGVDHRLLVDPVIRDLFEGS